MYFAVLAPTIIFGGLLTEITHSKVTKNDEFNVSYMHLPNNASILMILPHPPPPAHPKSMYGCANVRIRARCSQHGLYVSIPL
jgi:hypothetical protein